MTTELIPKLQVNQIPYSKPKYLSLEVPKKSADVATVYN